MIFAAYPNLGGGGNADVKGFVLFLGSVLSFSDNSDITAL
jgi:hypothetical protein